MKTLLSRLFDKFVDAFSTPSLDEQSEWRMYRTAVSIAEAESGERARVILPIGRAEAMSLRASVPWLNEKLGCYCVRIFDVYGFGNLKGHGIYTVHGETIDQVEKRTAQLISAMDGARRL